MELITEFKLKSKLVFYESALLFSAGLHGRFDLIILIESPNDVRLARAIARTGMNASEIEARVKTQKILPDISLHNLIRIDNSADIENLYQDAEAVVRILLEKLKINV
jgi:dephospho-CoA kinase